MAETPEPDSGKSSPTIPVAAVRTVPDGGSGRPLITRLWLATGLCFVVAVGLVIWNQKPSGPTITIQFKQGYGLKPGNALQHRGIEIGRVTSVELTPDADGVNVTAMLNPAAKSLARKGCRFWIVRPRVSLARVTGLETIVGARYIEVQPGSPEAATKFAFEGLETPLTLAGPDASEISIRFKEGHGLKNSAEVRHRGIVIGEVTSVDLNEDFNSVTVRVRLSAGASRLARVGTQFWVERPTLNVAEVRGLETLVGGRYIALQPGPDGTEACDAFTGLNEPPPSALPDNGLEIVLEAGQRGGLGRGAPVLYRGFRVGHVAAVGLTSDSATVEARAWIEAPYRHLIRENTVFWMDGGVDVKVGLRGVELSAESLSSILRGGVSLATPNQPGEPAETGKRFKCFKESQDEWLEWQPQLAIGPQEVADGVPLPNPLRVSLNWQQRVFGIRRNRSRTGWVLPLKDGRVFGLAELLTPVDKATEGITRLSCEGKSVNVTSENSTQVGVLAMLAGQTLFQDVGQSWPANLRGRPADPADCLVVTSGGTTSFGISAARLIAEENVWKVDASVPLTSEHHGASVVLRSDGKLAGFVSVTEHGAEIYLVPATQRAEPETRS